MSNQIGACYNTTAVALVADKAPDGKRLEAITLDASRGVATNDATIGAASFPLTINPLLFNLEGIFSW